MSCRANACNDQMADDGRNQDGDEHPSMRYSPFGFRPAPAHAIWHMSSLPSWATVVSRRTGVRTTLACNSRRATPGEHHRTVKFANLIGW